MPFDIFSLSTSTSPVTVDIAVNAAWSPSTVASGGVAFDPLSGGMTTVSAAAPGFDGTSLLASQTVTVSPWS